MEAYSEVLAAKGDQFCGRIQPGQGEMPAKDSLHASIGQTSYSRKLCSGWEEKGGVSCWWLKVFSSAAQRGLKGYAMNETTTLGVGNPGTVDDEVAKFREQFGDQPDGPGIVDQIIRRAAQQMLQKAIEEEVQEFVQRHEERRDGQGNRLVVRNGYQPARKIVTGAGALEVRPPRVRDNGPNPKERVHLDCSLV
jgi:hypothetical protein